MTLFGLVTLTAITLVHSWQVPPRPPQPGPPPAGRGVISGSLVTADKGTPVRKATVRLTRVTPGVTRTVTSDSEGRFTFIELPPGDYRLVAAKPGFLDVVYGSRQPGPASPGAVISVAEDQKIEKLVLTLPRGGVISGIVTDEFGDPSFNTSVRALRFTYQAGERVVTPAATVSTDDRGMYRIAGLLPGEYLVNAVPRDSVSTLAASASMARQVAAQRLGAAQMSGDAKTIAAVRDDIARMPPPPPAPPATGYVPVFYPGNALPAGATVVKVGMSAEVYGIDFPLLVMETATVSGVVTNTEGALPDDTRVQLIDPSLPVASVGVWFRNTEPDGRFAFHGVAPGTYYLRAHSSLPPSAGPGDLTAGMRLNVGPAGITDATLALRRGPTVSGKVTLDGLPQAFDPTRVRISLSPIPSSADWEMAVPRVSLDAEGSFEFRNVTPVRYRFTFQGLPDGWTLDSAVFNGVETADHHFTVDADGTYTGGVVKLTQTSSEINGLLSTVAGSPSADHTVLVFPVERAMWLPLSRRIRMAQAGKDGRYSIKGLPSGDYRVVALLGPDPGREFDPVWLSELFALSAGVTLRGGEARTHNITVR